MTVTDTLSILPLKLFVAVLIKDVLVLSICFSVWLTHTDLHCADYRSEQKHLGTVT